MSKHNSEPDRARALQDASAWRVRLNESNSESSLAFEAWLSESPAHRDAWEAVQAPWELLGEHASNTELVALRRGALARAHRASRGRVSPPFWRRMAAAAALVLVIGAGAMAAFFWSQTMPAVYATQMGERRSIELADGSRISLDSSSEVAVRYTDDARLLELRRGQARFDVTHDVARPFSVRAGGQAIVAVGTSFNVDVSGPDLLVTLIEGRLRIVPQPRADQDSRRVREISMTAGQQLDVPHLQPPVVRSVEAARAVAWERGQIDFVDEPLGEVARRVNFYSTRQIVITDPAVASMQLSGVVDTGDVDDFADLVSHYLPVRAETRADGDVVLSRAP